MGNSYEGYRPDGEENFYECSQWIPVRRALKVLEPDSTDVFVDLGSGRGQTLIVAGQLPFRRVIGVELNEKLHNTAVDNLARAQQWLRCHDVRSLPIDVRVWDFPDDVTVVFLFNPFIGDFFRDVLSALFASYDRRPRPLRIVYDYPWEHEWLLSTGRVRVVDVRSREWPTTPWWWRSGRVIVTYAVGRPGDAFQPQLQRRRRLVQSKQAMARWSGANGQSFALHRPGHAPLLSRPDSSEP